ncbi:MAG TPA: LptA/OstA family protein [Allosphingosinicella sp.]|nr:LptA/OstA family protein [Allosphingosinicella sp.]
MTRMRLSALILIGGAALAVGGNPAVGQTSALRGHNSNAPVDWSAERIEVQDRADRVILSGNVIAKQAELTLTAARITVAYSNQRGIQINRMDASGGVSLRSPGESARGDFAIYDLDRKLITLIGGVSLVQRDATVKGGRLTIDLDSGRAVMDGGGPPGTASQGGRVTGTFTVPQRRGG